AVVVVMVGIHHEAAFAAHEPGGLAVTRALGDLGQREAEAAQRLQRVLEHDFAVPSLPARSRARGSRDSSPGARPPISQESGQEDRVNPGIRMTKIVATIGPACDAPELLRRMIEAGMNVARLNLSHGTFDEQAQRVAHIREAAAALAANVAIMADTRGVEI